MITSSIARAQAQMARKVSVEREAASQKEWFDLNMKEP
jgi:hypothetical protein